MVFRQCIIALLLIALPELSTAEFYRYVDKEGNVRFTDNLANVPVDQRSKVNEYDEATQESRPGEKTEMRRQEGYQEETVKQIEEPPSQKEAPTEEGEENAAGLRLRDIGAKLEEEYHTLMEERDKLQKASTTRLAPSARKALIDNISDFNARIKDYENRRQAYNKQVEALNARIQEKAQPPKVETE